MPTPRLPVEPVLAGTTNTLTAITYQVVVAPLATPLDADSAEARARQIGAVVGLTDLTFSGPGDADGTWLAWFAQSFDGVPVEQGSIVLILRSDGTVERFVRTIGPRAPRPAILISQARAAQAVGPNAKPSSAHIEWARGNTDTFHLVWWLQFGGPNSTECDAYVDAGTAKVLFQGCLS